MKFLDYLRDSFFYRLADHEIKKQSTHPLCRMLLYLFAKD